MIFDKAQLAEYTERVIQTVLADMSGTEKLDNDISSEKKGTDMFNERRLEPLFCMC